jgi:hypothetical protein
MFHLGREHLAFGNSRNATVALFVGVPLVYIFYKAGGNSHFSTRGVLIATFLYTAVQISSRQPLSSRLVDYYKYIAIFSIYPSLPCFLILLFLAFLEAVVRFKLHGNLTQVKSRTELLMALGLAHPIQSSKETLPLQSHLLPLLCAWLLAGGLFAWPTWVSFLTLLPFAVSLYTTILSFPGNSEPGRFSSQP